MIKIEDPFNEVCREVFEEKYPDRKPVGNGNATLCAYDMPKGVVTEALKRFYNGQEPVISSAFKVKYVG